MTLPSSTKVDNAGKRLREFVRDGGSLDLPTTDPQLLDSVETVQAWRSQFELPLTGAAMGLRSMMVTCGLTARPTQRHKRLERIVQKLARPSSTRLSKMQDIAGVRAVVPDLASLRRLQDHIEQTWNREKSHTSGIVRESATRDYIALPKPSGYRAVHLIVDYNDRWVEVQLRTVHQHLWADPSERVSRVINSELKAGDGPEEVLNYFIELGAKVGSLDAGDTSPWHLALDLQPWSGQMFPQPLEVQYTPSS